MARIYRSSSTATISANPYPPGDRVTHDAFGLGTVVSTRGSGDDMAVTVDFGSSGTKTLVVRYAPVEKL